MVNQPGHARVAQGQHKGFMAAFMLALTFILCLTQLQAFAQGRTISGTVRSAEDNSALPGVTVQIKGTNRGGTTDAEGKYTLANVPDNATLVFSFIGMISQETAVGNRSTVDVTLKGDQQQLQEVVVVGYGTQRVKDATGSVVALGTQDFNKGVIASPEQLLQGRAAGIQVTPASGEPGAGVNIRIRGTTSVRSNNNPLFVIDGVPLDGGDVSDGGRDYGAGTQAARNPLNFLNPEDIENISVLKDASAAAIYGARGANGVVLITTKKGKAGQKSFNISANTSIGSTLRRYDLLSAGEYANAVKTAGGDPSSPAVNAGASTDWQKEIFRTSISQNYNLSYGGGNDDTRYYMSLGYSDIQGVVKKSDLRRITGRINATHELFNDKVVLDLQLTTSGVNDVYVPNSDNAGFEGNLIAAAIQSNPTYPVRDAQGRFFTPEGYNAQGQPQGNAFRNPVSLLEMIDDQGRTRRTLGNLGATWRIIEGLSYKFNLGLDNSVSERRTSIRRNIPGFDIPNKAGRAIIQNRDRSSTLLEHTLNYNRKLGPGNFDGLVGFAYQKFQNRGAFIQAEQFLPEADEFFPYANNIGAVNNQGSTKAYFAGSDRNQSELQSYFGRVNYNINDRYLLTATVRVDGSSKFGPNNKYGAFPSFAGAWRVSDESFLAGKGVDLKLRANWGRTGNQEFPPNLTQFRRGFDPNNAASSPDITPNPNLRWESTRQWGIGADLGFLKGRLTATIDFFNKNTSDLLFEALYAQPAPARSRWINLDANVINRGIELGINYDVLTGQDFTWSISANGTYLKNEVTNFSGLYNTGAINGQGLSGAYAQRIVGGRPLFSFFMPSFTGYDDQGFGAYTDPSLGLSYQGTAIPNYNWGLTNTFGYKNWGLMMFWAGAGGNYIYNNTANAIFTKGNLRNGRNVTKDAASSPENAVNPPLVSTRFLEKGDFGRLSNLVVSYNLPLPKSSAIRSLRFSLTGQNLLLITGYSGLDPEVNTNKAIDGIPSLGIDYTSYPSQRVFTFGINAGF
ncbi:iron complex outermembrane receptor protein [Larkinella arboricola]|uniref:Iron complex outermembrane receptor protein n=1 Tax=Larkinella arboricola TaxID=643671 RepID=A0A327X5M5_LARAB|nr:SusC/RagA family TonB-linked outer membrane protein [Larkinella arboricola]RAK02205.1 iron complex outermembrane receptor protein [Larkinella arboricola]